MAEYDVILDLQDHKKEDNAFHEDVHDMLLTIRDNHLIHLQAATSSMAADVEWIKKSYWLVFAALLGVIIKLFIH